jgi:Tfp pilus assembly protein PilF
MTRPQPPTHAHTHPKPPLFYHPPTQDPYSLPALLALGVSYVNELDSVRALQNLKAWVEHNPKYQVGTSLHVCM